MKKYFYVLLFFYMLIEFIYSFVSKSEYEKILGISLSSNLFRLFLFIILILTGLKIFKKNNQSSIL